MSTILPPEHPPSPDYVLNPETHEEAGKLALKSFVDAPSISENEAIDNAWSQLTPEQYSFAKKAEEALIKKFELDPSDVGLVMVKGFGYGEPDFLQPVIMHIGGHGISYDRPGHSKKEHGFFVHKRAHRFFEVEVDGQKVDTRKGMTLDTYRAFIADAKARGVEPLPDSPALSQKNHEPQAYTLLTDEERRSSMLGIVRTDDEGMIKDRAKDIFQGRLPGYRYKAPWQVYVRPVVVLDKIYLA